MAESPTGVDLDELNKVFASVQTDVKLSNRLRGRPSALLLTHSVAAMFAKFPERAADLQKELLALRLPPQADEPQAESSGEPAQAEAQVVKALTKHEQKEQALLKVLKLATVHKASRQYYPALLNYYKAAKELHLKNYHLHSKDIQRCYKQADDCLMELISRSLTPDVKNMHKLVPIAKDFLAMFTENIFMNHVHRVLGIASCQFHLASIMNFRDEHRRSLDVIDETIRYVEQQLPRTYQKYHGYAMLFKQQAASYLVLQEYDDAVKNFELSTAAFRTAEDYDHVEEEIHHNDVTINQINNWMRAASEKNRRNRKKQ